MKIKNMLFGLLLMSIWTPLQVQAEVDDQVVGEIRVQVLSSSLVRIEQKGPRGFEDRETFHIIKRNWAGTDVKREITESTVRISTAGFSVIVPDNANGFSGIAIVSNDGRELWSADKLDSNFFEDNRRWLPGPSDKVDVWAVCDTPRYIPAINGYSPAPGNSKDNGWDLGNDAKDVYVFLPGGDMKRLRKEFLDLTGRAGIMPLYAFGGWDSRYYPYKQQEALDKIDRYRSEQIPLDVFVVDTDWRVGASHGYGVNTSLFPDMEKFIADAHDKNVRITFNDHPEPQEKDVLGPAEVKYRNDGLRSKFEIGLDFWWFDRNWYTCIVPPKGLNKEVFGMYIYDSVTSDFYPDRRPIIMANFDGIDNGLLNRAPDIAAHRFTMQWTGDTSCDYSYLKGAIRNAVYAGVHAPFAYLSTDVGGFFGVESAEQYCRWIQYGTMSPVFRLHCMAGQTRNPWDYGKLGLDMVRDYVQMRMRLLPLFYSCARKNYETGEPILRRCDLEWPTYSRASDNTQYMLGDGILVAPICSDRGGSVGESWLSVDGKGGILARYYNNLDLTGDAVLTTVESNIDFDWRSGSPGKGVNKDGFSASFSGEITIDVPFQVNFGLQSDDGCRLWIDGELLIDQWKEQAGLAHWSEKVFHSGRSHSIKIEYYEKAGGAKCKLIYKPAQKVESERQLWLPPGAWIDCWTGQTMEGPTELARATPIREMPLYVRSGTIVPLAPDMQYTSQKPWDNIILDIYPDDDIVAEASLYEDDGMSKEYQDGAFRKTSFTAAVDKKERKVSIDIHAADGDYGAVAERSWTLRVRRPLSWSGGFEAVSASVNGSNSEFECIKRNPTAMPFTVKGGASDSDIIQIFIPSSAVDKSNHIEVYFKSF